MSELEQALRRLRDQHAQQTTGARPGFDHRLDALRHWQADHIVAYHHNLARRYNGEALLYFLACTFYRDADWSELTASPERVAARIGRIINNDKPLLVALDLQMVTNTLDAAVVRALPADSGDAGLSAAAYVRTFRRVGHADLRAQQLALLERLIDLLGRKADNRAAYWGFRMAKTPARALGLGDTYDLLADGFAALRATRDFKKATGTAIEHQRALNRRLLAQP